MSILDFFRPRTRTVVSPGQAGCIDPDLDRLTRWTAFTDHMYSVVVGEWTNPADPSDKRPVICDLTTAPHILVAGATGSGKSVSINAMLCSLLIKCCPNHLSLYIIDPKMVDYQAYKGIPHTCGYATDTCGAERIANTVYGEMMARYRQMQRAGARHVDDLGMGHVLLVMDECASFLCTGTGDSAEVKAARKRLQGRLAEIARLGRAAGVHMILATQYPTRTSLPMQIKVNCPTRVAFRVDSISDSRVILDAKGAEQLKGRGDGLIKTAYGDLWRFQGCYCSDQQVNHLADYWRKQVL